MATPSAPNSISMAQIAAEFGGTTPHSLSEYSIHAGIAAGSTISMDQMRGLSNTILTADLSGLYSFTSGGYGIPAVASYTIQTDGTHHVIRDGAGAADVSPNWYSGFTGAQYHVKFTTSSGDSYLHSSSTTRNTWHSMGTERYLLTFGSSTTNVRQSTTITVSVRSASTLSVLSTKTFTMDTLRIF